MTEDASLDRFAAPDATGSDADGRNDADSSHDDPVDGVERDADEPSAGDTDAGESVTESDSEEPTTGSDAEESVTDGGESAIPETADSPMDADPAVSTFEWSSGGGECADCGKSVERRWRADGERDGCLVCADCKEW